MRVRVWTPEQIEGPAYPAAVSSRKLFRIGRRLAAALDALGRGLRDGQAALAGLDDLLDPVFHVGQLLVGHEGVAEDVVLADLVIVIELEVGVDVVDGPLGLGRCRPRAKKVAERVESGAFDGAGETGGDGGVVQPMAEPFQFRAERGLAFPSRNRVSIEAELCCRADRAGAAREESSGGLLDRCQCAPPELALFGSAML
jgi:hypothetical protein